MHMKFEINYSKSSQKSLAINRSPQLHRRIHNTPRAETPDPICLSAPTKFYSGQKTSEAMQDEKWVERKNGDVLGSVYTKLLSRIV